MRVKMAIPFLKVLVRKHSDLAQPAIAETTAVDSDDLFGSVPDTLTLEEAREERLNKI